MQSVVEVHTKIDALFQKMTLSSKIKHMVDRHALSRVEGSRPSHFSLQVFYILICRENSCQLDKFQSRMSSDKFGQLAYIK